MQGKAVWATFSKYLVSLVLTILAPLQWIRMVRVAGKHTSLDAHAPKKVVVGIVAGLALAGVATYTVVDFQDDATQGVYETLSGRLSAALGNEAYNAHVQDEEAARNLIDTADRKIAEAQAEGDAEKEQIWKDNRAGSIRDLNAALAGQDDLAANHALWLQVDEALVEDRDDDRAKQLIATQSGLQRVSTASVDSAFVQKDETMADMQQMLQWFVYPGLIGVLWAPVAFAAGHVLKTTFVPSDTVGYKPYPGGAASLFLLFGAFGVPALFFAAWVMQDFADRTEVGQISL